MIPLLEAFGPILVIILTPIVTSYAVRKVLRPLPPIGGAKILQFRHRK